MDDMIEKPAEPLSVNRAIEIAVQRFRIQYQQESLNGQEIVPNVQVQIEANEPGRAEVQIDNMENLEPERQRADPPRIPLD